VPASKGDPPTMNRRTALRLGAPLAIAAVMAAACSSSKSSTQSTTPPASSGTTAAPLSGTISGSGSTFQAAYNAAAIQGFTATQKGVTINYNPVGSGQGQTDLAGQLTDFAGSDVPVPASSLSTFKGGSILYFPTVAGPITVSYNLSGVSSLQLSGTTLGGIFSGAIKKWNDPAIAAENSGVTLPSTSITVVHRSDGSGTTANFTAYLKVAGGSAWTLGAGKTVNWPASFQAGKGNTGVAQIVKGTNGAVGYIDYSDAKATGLSFASIKNYNGKYIAPSLDGATAAIASATINTDLTYNPINAQGDTAYPITSPTYIIVYSTQTDANKGNILKAFLTYILSTDGQNLAATVDFAKLPSSLVTQAQAQIAKITG